MANPADGRTRFSYGVILSACCLALGVVFVAVALVAISAQSVKPIEPYRALESGPATIAIGPVNLERTSAIPFPYPKAGDHIGTLSIPVLNKTLPIVEGTGTKELKQGVGHFIQSVMPGENDNCVLSGHRDTVFTDLGKLKIGDIVIAQMTTGDYTYSITNIRIVDKDDRTVIVPTDHAVLTISTCYPFRYVGNAPDRYILTADLIEGE